MGSVMTQQNIADRSGNEDGTSVPTSTIHMPFFLIGETAFLSPLLKRHLGWWKWKRFFPIHWLQSNNSRWGRGEKSHTAHGASFQRQQAAVLDVHTCVPSFSTHEQLTLPALTMHSAKAYVCQRGILIMRLSKKAGRSLLQVTQAMSQPGRGGLGVQYFISAVYLSCFVLQKEH